MATLCPILRTVSLRRRSLVGAMVVCVLLSPPSARSLPGQTPEARDEAGQLLQNAQELYSRGDYRTAVYLLEQSSKLLEGDPGTSLYGLVLAELSLLYKEVGAYGPADSLSRRALQISSRNLELARSESSPYVRRLASDHAIYLRRRGALLMEIGALSDAEECLVAAMRSDSINFGPQSPKLADDLNALGVLFERQSRYSAAEAALLRAAAILEDEGPHDEQYAAVLGNLANLYMEQGRYQQAEALYVRALEIDAAVLAERDPSLAIDHSNLGLVYAAWGDVGEAERHYRIALGILESLGSHHPTRAKVLSNMAALELARADWAAAESLYASALQIDTIALGHDHSTVAVDLNNLSALYQDLGQFERAETLLRQALAIDSARTAGAGASYLRKLSNLASLYYDQGRFDRAEAIQRRVVEGRRQVFLDGAASRPYAQALSNLAVVVASNGKPEAAIQILHRAIQIEFPNGEIRPELFARTLNLASFNEQAGNYRVADSLYSKAIELGQTLLPPAHPNLALALRSRALLSLRLGRPDSAFADLEEALSIEAENLSRVFAFTSEGEMLAYASRTSVSLTQLLTLVHHATADDSALAAGVVTSAMSWVMRRKGQVLARLRQYRRVQSQLMKDPELQRLWRQYREWDTRLAQLQGAIPGDSMAAWRVRREEAEDELHRLLAAASDAESSWESVTVEAVRGQLPERAALVEVVGYWPLGFEATGDNPEPKPQRYLAFVLKRDGDPAVVDLGEVESVNRLVADVQAALGRPGSGWSPEAARDLESGYKEVAQDLYGAIMAPIESHLSGVQRLYVAPAGELSAVPWEALVDRAGSYVQESLDIVYLTSGRDLLREPASRDGFGVVVLAAPDFGADIESRQRRARELGIKTQVAPRTRGLEPRSWSSLPATATEADSVRVILTEAGFGQVQAFLGDSALEEVLKQEVRAPKILHLATHGYFEPRPENWERQCEKRALEQRIQQLEGDGTEAARRFLRLECIQDPMLRSGVVLAGANEESGGGLEDGWVTARELAMLDLQGTELLVLSACDTGRGDVLIGEGVYGLRRALDLAGAHSVLMTLHKIPDAESQWLTSRFYRLWAVEGYGKLAALRQAREEMIENRRECYGTAHPFFWAAFVLQGDPN